MRDCEPNMAGAGMEFTAEQQQRLEGLGWRCANLVRWVDGWSKRVPLDDVEEFACLILERFTPKNDPAYGVARRKHQAIGDPRWDRWSLFLDIYAEMAEMTGRVYKHKSICFDLREFVNMRRGEFLEKLQLGANEVDVLPWELTEYGRRWLQWKESGAVERP